MGKGVEVSESPGSEEVAACLWGSRRFRKGSSTVSVDFQKPSHHFGLPHPAS